MIFSKNKSILTIVYCLLVFGAKAQEKPIGSWESILPYNNDSLGLATDGTTLFVICNQSFFTFNYKGAIETYAKESGMSDIGMQRIGYDHFTNTVILTYTNGNIDLFKNNTFYNIPDLKLKNVTGTKAVYQIYTENGKAYLSSSLGVVVVDIANRSISETYQLIHQDSTIQVIAIRSFTSDGSYFYAATDYGLYRADKNSNDLQNYQVWQKVDSVHSIKMLQNLNGKLFLANSDTVFDWIGDTIHMAYASPVKIQHIDAGLTKLLIGGNGIKHGGDLRIMDLSYNIVDSFDCFEPTVQAVQIVDTSIWMAGIFSGLLQRTGVNQVGGFNPPGPIDPYSFDIYAYNKDVYIAHGGYDVNFYELDNHNGVSHLNSAGKWNYYKQYTYSPFDSLINFTSVLKDEKTGTVYFGSFYQGLFILNPDGGYQLLDTNSIFDRSTAYTAYNREIIGLALDPSDNLWVTTMYSQHILYAKSADSVWYKFNTPGIIQGGQIVIDDYGQVWFVSSNGGGVGIYNTGGTLADQSDDHSYHLTSGVGNGNLPSNNVNCIAKDKNNQIWIGTDDGIGIVSGCTLPPSSASYCDALLPIVQYDQYAGYLFKGSNVRTIAVDGANRKWVGTDDAAWLLSPNADKIIYKFTVDNSPLPSNQIRKISIDPITGDVYIGTEQGLIKFRGTATDGGTTNQNVTVFPDPVKSGYTGTIAIKGLVNNADVRITDIDGHLVYRTQALGGQAVWNGKDYTGRRPQSGVYLIFSASADGTQSYVGKIAFIQ